MGRILIVVLADLLLSTADVAVRVTMPPGVPSGVGHGGTVIGAVNVVEAPLCVDVGLKESYEMELQVAVHLTPWRSKSLVTVAVKVVD